MKKKPKKRLKQIIKENKLLVSIISIALIAILAASGTKIFLYLNFLLGNDTVIKLEADKEVLLLEHNQEDTVKFHSSLTTNPFCKAVCAYEFIDISSNKTLDKDQFTIRPAVPFNKEYILKAERFGNGLELYRFDMRCSSRRTILCHTSEKPTTRSTLIGLRYNLTKGEKEKKEDIKQYIENRTAELSRLKRKQESYSSIISTEEVKTLLEESIDILNSINKKYRDYDYDINQEKTALNNNINRTKSELSALNQNISEIIIARNKKIQDLRVIRKGLLNLTQQPLNLPLALRLDSKIKEFNNMTLVNLTELKQKIKLCSQNITNTTTNATNQSCTLTNYSFTPISNITLAPIQLPEITPIPINITIKEPVPQCCVFGNCKDCCTGKCKNNPDNFPIIFLHGHSINKETSAEYSLEGFNKIQNQLEKDNYLDAGSITLFTSVKDIPKGLFGMPDIPMTFRGSYYFDIFAEPENYVVVQTKSESIDTYALRLDELIQTLKYRTGYPKVRIIAFSMGGLVARKYLQIYGEKDTDKLIMIGTPNKGITGEIARLCPVTGEGLECRDMDADSLFINKLNRAQLPDIPIHNIVGSGCNMDGKDGDGAVLTQNALLDGADNHIINGTCRSKTNPLHLDLRDISRYPKVYNIIKTALKE
ncbi:alpha/beta hydrolase [Candidatus Woesearchaeota archaeon]|nr:alpha/beta hydrolase [Candidatus Woesearchaeota archaeon]